MAGIYIHIPFCKKRCIYCDFFSSTHVVLKAEYINALCKEIELRKDYLGNEIIKTIYIGGGTPSMLSEEDFRLIFNSLAASFDLSVCEEITIEANPDDLTVDYIKSLRNLPVNRISIGIQSFDEQQLSFLNRRHDAKQAIRSVENSFTYGFDNISIDLIYGFPNQTVADFRKDLVQGIELPVKHLSAYHLTYEQGTFLYRKLLQQEITPLKEDTSVAMFEMLLSFFSDTQIKQYEISNFSIPGFESKHNTAYWKGEKYLGLGASAHSYDGVSRQWNVSSIATYIQGIKQEQVVFEKETIDEKSRYNEFLMTRLRTINGFSIHELEQLVGNKYAAVFVKDVCRYIENNSIENQAGNFRFSKKGLLLSDGILSDLFIV